MVDTRRQEDLVADQTAVSSHRVTIVGCGAIGSVVAEMLSRAGVDRFRLIDGDDVEDHNLNRQLYDAKHVGWNKAEALKVKLSNINTGARVMVTPRYVHPDDVDLDRPDVVFSAVDSLYFKGQLFERVRGIEDRTALYDDGPVACIDGRMNGFVGEVFAHWPFADENPVDASGHIYFDDEPDPNYSVVEATCTAAPEDDEALPSITTTTNMVCSFMVQAFIHYTQKWSWTPHFRLNLREDLS